MTEINFCTIVTADYIHYAVSLRDSLLQFGRQVNLFILVSGFTEGLQEKVEQNFENIYIIYPHEICKDGVGKSLYDKYAETHVHAFRWSVKPILLMYLLQQKGIEKVIYVDSDIRFYSDCQFLFDALDTSIGLLTPHWRPSDPAVDETQFFSMYTSGLYNAGFIAVNAKAIDALTWWAKTNVYICEIDASKGQFFDQSHLNLLPIYFDGVISLKHMGCNVAGWNITECRRTPAKDGSVLINNIWPIVFIHFSNHTISLIETGADELLKPHLQVYNERIKYFADLIGIKPVEETIEPKAEKISLRSFSYFMNILKNRIDK